MPARFVAATEESQGLPGAAVPSTPFRTLERRGESDGRRWWMNTQLLPQQNNSVARWHTVTAALVSLLTRPDAGGQGLFGCGAAEKSTKQAATAMESRKAASRKRSHTTAT